MIRFGVNLFFDREAVMASMDKVTRLALSNFGAYVRQRAKTSMRKRPGASAPGTPPNAHVGLIRKAMVFRYDPREQSVAIGPVPDSGRLGGNDALGALEHGGISIVNAGTRRRPRKRKVNIRARPFMQPAFEAELSNLSSMWERARDRA